MMTWLAGTWLAFALSWVFNHSAPWAILHAALNWLYVAYKGAWYVVANF